MLKIITLTDLRARGKAQKAADMLKAGKQPKKLYLELLESRNRIASDELLSEQYCEIYGIWFCGSAAHAVGMPRQGGFSVKTLPPGIHQGTFYGGAVTVYSWQAQGYPRGIVLASADSVTLHEQAAAIMASGPWNPTPILQLTEQNPTLTDKIKKAIRSAQFCIAE